MLDFFADFVPIGVLDELFQMVHDSNDFGQTNDSNLADSGFEELEELEEFGQISATEDPESVE